MQHLLKAPVKLFIALFCIVVKNEDLDLEARHLYEFVIKPSNKMYLRHHVNYGYYYNDLLSFCGFSTSSLAMHYGCSLLQYFK